MHRILLREVVLDVPADLLDAERDFWSQALATEASTVPDHPEFVALRDPAALPVVGLQGIGDGPARFHLDIESDDVEAEVARLVRLGATEQGRHRSWVVLRDPAGLLCCVVPPESDQFADRSREVE